MRNANTTRFSHWLGKVNLEAQKSVEEAEEETLTVVRLGAPMKLRSTLSSTNPIESAFDGVRSATKRIKHWRRGNDKVARWGGGNAVVEKRFKLVPGHKEIPVLLAALRTKKLIANAEVA